MNGRALLFLQLSRIKPGPNYPQYHLISANLLFTVSVTGLRRCCLLGGGLALEQQRQRQRLVPPGPPVPPEAEPWSPRPPEAEPLSPRPPVHQRADAASTSPISSSTSTSRKSRNGEDPATKSDEFFEKCQSGGGHFQSKNLCCRFWEL